MASGDRQTQLLDACEGCQPPGASTRCLQMAPAKSTSGAPTRDAAVQEVLAAVAVPCLHQLLADALHFVCQPGRLAKGGAVVEAPCTSWKRGLGWKACRG